MKLLPFMLCGFLLVSCSAGASEWTQADANREAVWQVLHIIDFRQTSYMVNHPKSYHELNRDLGDHPSQVRVDEYFVVSSLTHYFVSSILPRQWRDGWQYVTIGVWAENVYRNYQVGVHIQF